MTAPIDEAYQAYKPTLTYCGKQELQTYKSEEDPPIYRFLQQCAEG